MNNLLGYGRVAGGEGGGGVELGCYGRYVPAAS